MDERTLDFCDEMLQYYISHCVQSRAVAVHRVSVKVELPAV